MATLAYFDDILRGSDANSSCLVDWFAAFLSRINLRPFRNPAPHGTQPIVSGAAAEVPAPDATRLDDSMGAQGGRRSREFSSFLFWR